MAKSKVITLFLKNDSLKCKQTENSVCFLEFIKFILNLYLLTSIVDINVECQT